MITIPEYQNASDMAQFIHKGNHFAQPKSMMRFKINQIAEQYVTLIRNAGGNPAERQYAKELHELLAATLEEFEIKEVSEVDGPAREIPSKDGKGKYCHKCGLQKLNKRHGNDSS